MCDFFLFQQNFIHIETLEGGMSNFNIIYKLNSF